MEKLGTDKTTATESPTAPDRGKMLRVDAAHQSISPFRGEQSSPCSGISVSEGQEADDRLALAQVQSHAAELHEQLMDRLRELDRREALLNTRAAEAENEVRRAQLVVSEREAVVRNVERKLEARCAELDARDARLTAEETACRVAQQQNQREAAALAEIQKRQIEWQQREADCQQRERRLDAAGKLLEQQMAESRRHAEQLREQQRQLDIWSARQQQEWAKRQRQWQEQMEARQKGLDLQAETLQKKQIALTTLERDIGQMHRQTLETRLITEQLRIHLQQDVSDAELSRATAHWRVQLAELLRPAEAKLTAKRDEIKQLVIRLKKRRQDLETRRDQLQAWFQQQQTDLEKQMEMLTAGEQQLQQQRWELWQQREAWNQQRFQLDQQIRDLTLQLQRSTRPAGLPPFDGEAGQR
jgi:hypothetical protein